MRGFPLGFGRARRSCSADATSRSARSGLCPGRSASRGRSGWPAGSYGPGLVLRAAARRCHRVVRGQGGSVRETKLLLDTCAMLWWTRRLSPGSRSGFGPWYPTRRTRSTRAPPRSVPSIGPAGGPSGVLEAGRPLLFSQRIAVANKHNIIAAKIARRFRSDVRSTQGSTAVSPRPHINTIPGRNSGYDTSPIGTLGYSPGPATVLPLEMQPPGGVSVTTAATEASCSGRERRPPRAVHSTEQAKLRDDGPGRSEVTCGRAAGCMPSAPAGGFPRHAGRLRRSSCATPTYSLAGMASISKASALRRARPPSPAPA